MLYANVSVFCCTRLLRLPLYFCIIFPLMVVVEAWISIVSFYQFNWQPSQIIVNYYSYLALESTIYFIPSCFVKYSYRLRSKLAMLLCSYKSKSVASNKLNFFGCWTFVTPARQTGKLPRTYIHLCMHAFIYASIHTCVQWIYTEHPHYTMQGFRH